MTRFIDMNPEYNGRFRYEGEPQPKWILSGTLPRALGPDLESGIIRAAGVGIKSDKLVWVPAESWRHRTLFEGTSISMTEVAMLGRPVLVRLEDKSFESVRPFIAEADFCRWCSEEPLEGLLDPPLTPDGLNVTVSGTPLSAEARSTLWMRAYALGMNHAGGKPKRDETLKLCRTEVNVKWRQAAAAWEALPAEWRNANRRPK